MYEVKRGDGNLNAHEANAEVSRPGVISFGSGGFTLLNNNAHVNQSGDDFIYVAIAEGAAFLDTTELTCATDTGLADIDAVGGEVYMTDGSIELDGSYTKSEYTPTTSNIASVTETVGYDLFSTTLYTGNWHLVRQLILALITQVNLQYGLKTEIARSFFDHLIDTVRGLPDNGFEAM